MIDNLERIGEILGAMPGILTDQAERRVSPCRWSGTGRKNYGTASSRTRSLPVV